MSTPRMGQKALFVGLATLDIAQLVDRFPREDSKTLASDTFLGAGGPAANGSVAYAALADISPVLLTTLGTHQLAEIVRSDLTSRGVTIHDLAPEEQRQPPVSSIISAQDNQSRTIVSLDASRIPPILDPQASAGIEDVAIVLSDCHHPDLAASTLALHRARGATTVIDAGRWKPNHEQLFPLADIAICSSTWSHPEEAGRGADGLFKRLHSWGIRHAAITHGREPIQYSSADGDRGEIAVPATPAVDTLGAGDILHGAFCWYYLRDGDFAGALRRASEVAALSTRYLGTREWIEHRELLPS